MGPCTVQVPFFTWTGPTAATGRCWYTPQMLASPPPSISPLVWIAIVLTSGLAGAINAVAGGGTFLLFPALTGLGRLTEKAANMTATIGLWPGSVSAAIAARSETRKLPRPMLLTYSVISLVGGGLGAYLLVHTSAQTFVHVIPWLLGFATLVFAFSKPIAKWAGRHHAKPSLKWTLLVAVIQFFISVYGGYFGAGIGVLMLAGLSFAGLESIHQTNALKVLLATLINAVAVVIFLFGEIDWRLAPAMAVASAIGGFLGMRVAGKLKPEKLRYIILCIGITLTTVYFYRSFHE